MVTIEKTKRKTFEHAKKKESGDKERSGEGEREGGMEGGRDVSPPALCHLLSPHFSFKTKIGNMCLSQLFRDPFCILCTNWCWWVCSEWCGCVFRFLFSLFLFRQFHKTFPSACASICQNKGLKAVQIKGRQFSVRATAQEVKGERRKRKVAKGSIESQINQTF